MEEPVVIAVPAVGVAHGARIPDWPNKALAERLCPLCGEDGTLRLIRPDGLKVRKCRRCGILFVSPAPTEEAVAAFYADYQRSYVACRNLDENEILSIRAASMTSSILLNELRSAVDLRGKRVVDVGCGRGQVLWWLRNLGAEVTGVDLDAEAVAFVRRLIGTGEVMCGTILDLTGTFDAIVMKDLIEHPLKPLDVLKQAVALLSPGGIIAVWTPNGSSLLTDECPMQVCWDFEHMQYLTFDSCLWLAQHLGLGIIHMEAVGFPSPMPTTQAGTKGSGWKAFVRRLPVMEKIIQWRHGRHRARQDDPRQGRYHLYCLFQKKS